MRFSIIDVLNDYKIKFNRKGDKLELICPFHGDQNPSGEVNVNTGFFRCWACKKGANFYRLLATLTGQSTKEIYNRLSRYYYEDDDNPINPIDVQKAHVKIETHGKLLEELQHRCVDLELIREYKLGVWSINNVDRISIPIANPVGDWVNLRFYLPGATKQKFLNSRGRKRSEIRLFPIEQLSYDKILLCGGEIKALAALKVLNQYDIGAIAPTCGEGAWDVRLNNYFADKVVFVCSDIDQAGKESAEKRCRLLKNVAEEVYKIVLPLDELQFPKGDINDFLRVGGDLYELICKAEPWKLEIDNIASENEEAIECDLDTAVSSSLVNRRVAVKVLVSSMDTSPYSIPKDVQIKCPRGEKDYCSVCPVMINTEPASQILTVGKEQIEIMEMIGRELNIQQKVLKKAFSIPVRCNYCEFLPISKYNVEDVRISQHLDISSRVNERSMQIAYCVGSSKIELNGTYTMEGRMYPHPSNQQAALLISKYEATQDALSSYTPKSLDHLMIFQPKEWTLDSLKEKLNDIYSDLEANITRIFERRNLHLAIDFSYHSPLFITFDKNQEKGWVEVLIIGDSSQGKSQAGYSLLQHYGLGERVDCNGATPAGLLGGVQQYGKRWFITWGKIPTNDRGLVFLEEVKGTSHEVISKLRDMRSSGIAEITKIEKRRAHARTRLVWISNPKSNRPIASYNYGVDTVLELVGNLEDIRRYTMVLILSKDEVNVVDVQRYRPQVPHKYTSDLCRELILFSWTVPNVVFENEARVLDLTVELCKRYNDDIPIVDRGEMRFKLARLAAALACRTFSLKPDTSDTVLVRDCHVQYVYNMLIELYDAPHFGYKEFSERIANADKLVNPAEVKSRIETKTKYPKDFVEHIICQEDVDIQFIQDTLGWDQSTARDLLTFFIRQRALKRVGRIYRKTTEFTQLLKEMSKNGLHDDRPSYLKAKNDEF